jgi:hypothetical protein
VPVICALSAHHKCSHKVLMGYGYFDHSTGGSCPGATIMVFFIRPMFLNSASVISDQTFDDLGANACSLP